MIVFGFKQIKGRITLLERMIKKRISDKYARTYEKIRKRKI